MVEYLQMYDLFGLGFECEYQKIVNFAGNQLGLTEQSKMHISGNS